jgi:asparagine synthetase B (glutamine-hydrolysing)
MAAGLAVGMALTELLDAAIVDIYDEFDEGPGWTKRLGVVVSGGLDSSTVACLSSPLIPSFTGYYDLPGFDEREYAHLVKHNEHHDILITPEDFVEHFDGMKQALRPLLPGMGAFGQYMVAKYLSQQGIEVAISGEGSDELFGGYARQMIVAGEAPPEGYEDYVLPPDYPQGRGPLALEAALAHDFALLPALLAVDDQMLGAFGVKARAPFTDQRIVEYGLGLPVIERVGKRHLRERVRGIVPDVIIDRKDKRGFPAPLVHWANTVPAVGRFISERIGYIPDPSKPWDRGWWYEIIGQ